MGVVQDPFVQPYTERTSNQNRLLVKADIPCSVQQARANVMLLFAQRNTEVDTTIHMAQDPGAQVNDLFIATDRTGNQTKYLVLGTAQPVGRGRTWEMQAKYIQQPPQPPIAPVMNT